MALPPQILEDSTETLYLYPPLEAGLGAVSSATVRVQTPSTSLPAAGDAEAATVDTVSTTLSAAAAQGATSVAVASATGIDEGVRYFVGLGAVDDDFVIVRVRRQVSTALELSDPLPIAVSGSDTFKGFRVSHALSAAETSTRGEGLAVWVVTYASGATRTVHQQFRVVRQRLHHTLDVPTLVSKYPHVQRLRPASDEKLQEVIDAAWEDRVVPALEARQIDVWTIKSAERLEQVVAAAAVWHLVSGDEAASEAFVERVESEWQTQIDTALRGRHFWVDEGDDLAVRDEDAAPGAFTFTGYSR